MTFCRLAAVGDLEAIERITNESVILMNSGGNFQWNADYPLPVHFKKDIEDSTLWVAEYDNEVVGFAALTTDQPDEYKNVGWDITKICIVPHRLAVSPAARGKGIAQALLKQAEILSKERGYDEIRLDTNKVNLSMRGVFEKMGYRFIGETHLAGKPSDMRFVCYSKMLFWEV